MKYLADVDHVREVSLRGAADLAFWADRLRSEKLVPTARDGRAQILVVAAAMKFMGVRFTELSISVVVSGSAFAGWESGVFLVQAFNSSRLFTWCERVLFATPYRHAHCHVSVFSPLAIQLALAGRLAFGAEMQSDPKKPQGQPLRMGEETWEGPVFLPRNGRGNAAQGRFFFAKMKGQTTVYPFTPADDALSIMPSQDAEIFRALLDSGFTGEEWIVREDATHGKSRSYARSELSAP